MGLLLLLILFLLGLSAQSIQRYPQNQSVLLIQRYLLYLLAQSIQRYRLVQSDLLTVLSNLLVLSLLVQLAPFDRQGNR